MLNQSTTSERDQSTSSVTKWANGHWHAIIASSCIRGSRCTALIILSLRSRAVVHHCCSPILWVRNSERVRALQRSSGGRGLTGEKSGSRENSHTRSVRWPAPLRTSALKIANFSKRVKRVIVRFWVWSVSGASGRSRSLPHVSGHSARCGGFRGWFMFFLWGHDHLVVAQ